ncbi:MAG: hypothetical protein MUC28_04080 [Planctomycetes bacterium]|nr:hypothetical protein [Planctomycetota bacterium]
MLYNRFLPLLVPVLVWLALEIYLKWPKMVYAIVCLVWLLFFFAVSQFIKASRSREKLSNYILLPSYFFVGAVSFSAMTPNNYLVQLIFFVSSLFIYYYFRSVYYHLLRPEIRQPYSPENLSAYGNFIAFYFISSALFGLQSFLNIAVWNLMILMLIAIALAAYQAIWAIGIEKPANYLFILVACLVLVELAWSVSFLPLSFYILGLVMAIYYYILMGIMRDYLLKKLDKKTVRFYLLSGFASLLAVLVTARWL